MTQLSPRRRFPEERMSDQDRRKGLYQEVFQNREQNATPPWYLEDSRYGVRDGNSFHVYYDGKSVFYDIAHSILHAQKSVDIVCTFFDPAMLLTRNRPRLPEEPEGVDNVNYSQRSDGDLHSAWSERDSFGGIILAALKRNPKLQIRLVIWHHEGNKTLAYMGVTESNIIGVNLRPDHPSIDRTEGATGFDVSQIPDPEPDGPVEEVNNRKYESLHLRSRTPEAANYSRQWFQRVAWEVNDPQTDRHHLFDRLSITRRAITTPYFLVNEDPLVGAEAETLQVGCDHQKTVLIDIDDADRAGSDPHGYVLGHNYFTEYWTEFPFIHRDPRHEMDHAPFHDFSMQIRGPLLIDLNHNFCQAYGLIVPEADRYKAEARSQRLDLIVEGRVIHPLRMSPQTLPSTEPDAHYPLPASPGCSPARRTVAPRTLCDESAEDLFNRRTQNPDLVRGLHAEKGKSSGQVVRTRPDQQFAASREQEKEIKDAYLQVARHATNYMLIVNQYFQYNRLARQIKDWKRVVNEAFQAQSSGQAPRKLYMFLGTCKPERHGMVFRTQQMANEFGVGDQFETAFNEMYDAQRADPEDGSRRPMRTRQNWRGATVPFISDLISEVRPMEHFTSSDMKALHIKPLLFMFYTPIPRKDESDHSTESENEQRNDHPADRVAQQVYVHAKLMVQDDAWFTLGSANTNIRSFAVDSELNIISDDYKTAKKTRYDLLKAYVGDIKKEFGEVFPNVEAEGEALTQVNLEKIHELIEKRMEKNYEDVMDNHKTINGLIVKFHDERSVNIRRDA